ncbi:MAG: type II secretion system F family protein [Verrucomicrobiota bacterium]|nr:type II secretion system F family protein [Verrucomicrobiota bacterium]MEC7235147.1 type II secretion system F family protein [Verrucomicrobiota bacterium]MEC8614803.1 type II secretion system F family protein [Verrucomicrobiota bacterium]MEE2988082.1 type II secretion system F family protein [Verrucomicrobiota bacterium]
MPEFNYKAVALNGRLLEGHREAENVKRLTVLLAQDGLELVDSELRDKSAAKRHSRLKMKTAELANLIFQIGIQLRAGVPIVEALKSREGEDASGAQTIVRQRLSEIVEQGTPLSQGLEEFPRVFPGYIRNIVQVAERSGSLDENFIELRDYLEWMDQNWKAFKQAMLYPAFVLGALTIFIFIALRFVFPTITELLFELDIPLPLLTRMMIVASNFVVDYWAVILAVLFVTPPGLRLLFKVSKRAALLRDHFLLKLPFLGDVILTLAVARFLRSLILTQKAGIVITESLSMGREVVGNLVIERSVTRIETAVSNGSTISSTMAKDSTFPTLVRTMVGVGERSGSLDTSLQAVVDYYDDLVPRKIKTFFAVLEPGLIVLTVCLAGLVAAAVFLPLVNMLTPGAY